VIAREEQAVAGVDKDRVIVGVARRPAQLGRAPTEVDAPAVIDTADVIQIIDALAHGDPRLSHPLVDVAWHAVSDEPVVCRVDGLVSLRPGAPRCRDLRRVHEDLGARTLERARHANVIRMQVRDEHALQILETDAGVSEPSAKRLFGLDRMQAGVDEAPTVRSLDEVRVDDRKTADR